MQQPKGRPLTVFQDLIIVALFSAAYAWTAPDEYGEPLLERASFRRTLLAFALGWLPVGIYLLVRYYSWSWWYFLTETDFPGLLTAVALAGEGLAAVGAYALIAALLEAGARVVAGAVTAGLAGLLAGATILPWERLQAMGTYEEYLAGTADPLMGTPHQWLQWTAIGAWIGGVYGWLLLRNLGRRSREPGLPQ